ncbi:DUF3307 domain-containing protein [Glaciecola sp. 1036]|uniref:DUF3307 domain-containing protein n=1 Tax=Alteromonadaceae TaxID=72275 RepID=UPI003CFE2DFB
MLIFFSLLCIHFVADFFLQKDAWIQSKIKFKIKSIGLLKHVLVHLVLNAIVLFILLDGFALNYFIALFTIVLTHYAIDIWKCYQVFSIRAFLIDQCAHILILFAVSLYLNNHNMASVISQSHQLLNVQTLAVITAYIFVSRPLSFVIQLTLNPYTKVLTKDKDNQGLENAGEWIGILERFLVLTFILIGQYSGVGFLLAAKSVFRFGDMRQQKDRKLTEYIMLGSLLSIGTALIVGIGVSQILA